MPRRWRSRFRRAQRPAACRCDDDDCHQRSRQAVRRVHRGRRRDPRRHAGRDSRLPRPQRRRQDDDDPDDRRAAEADRPGASSSTATTSRPSPRRPRRRSASSPIGRSSTRSSRPASSCASTAACTASTATASPTACTRCSTCSSCGAWEHELVESFSHGMKQRLVMCAAFLHRPRAVRRRRADGRASTRAARG